MFSVDASVSITSDLNSREGRISVKMSLQRGQIHCLRPESEGARWCSSNKLGSAVGETSFRPWLKSSLDVTSMQVSVPF